MDFLNTILTRHMDHFLINRTIVYESGIVEIKENQEQEQEQELGRCSNKEQRKRSRPDY